VLKRIITWPTWVFVFCCAAAYGADSTNGNGSKGGDLYQRISQAYLDGKWDDLDKELGVSSKEVESLTAAQQADVAYISKVLAECRQPWWKQCKKGKRVEIHPVIWGRSQQFWFEPADSSRVTITTKGTIKLITVFWPVADMDNPDHAEHGYSKGDLSNLTACSTLGIAMAWLKTPPKLLANPSEQDKLMLTRYQEFRGNLTGLYYGTPKARRWGVFLYLLSWMEKYSQMPAVGSRKAAGAMILAEVLANPANYPTIPLPGELAAEGAEEILAEHVRNKIEKQSWTIAEDKTLRDAIKVFAAANDSSVLAAQKATLPNKLSVSLDPEADKPLRAKRDAWLKAQFDKAVGTVH
jgi:hypothetical protein